MTIDEIRKLRNAEPFRPFELVAKSGKRVVINRPLGIALAPSGRSVAGYDPKGHSFFFLLTELDEIHLKKQRRSSRPHRNGR